MFGVVILPLHVGRGLFYHSNFNCFNIDEEETKLILRSSHSNLWLFLKICKCYNFKQTKSPLQLHQIVLLFIRSHCRRCKLRSKLLHRCILRNIMTIFTIQLRYKTPLILVFFPLHCPFAAATYLFITQLNLSETVVSASQICCSRCCSLSLSLSVWPNM